MQKTLTALIIFFAIIILFLLIGKTTNSYTIGGTCDFIGGWGRGIPRSCNCVGGKIVVDDGLSVDGNYHTICIGLGLYKND